LCFVFRVDFFHKARIGTVRKAFGIKKKSPLPVPDSGLFDKYRYLTNHTSPLSDDIHIQHIIAAQQYIIEQIAKFENWLFIESIF